jgi:hypothetical protein
MWRAWWRKQKQRGVWHSANTTMVILLAALAMFAILVGSAFALKSLNSGATDRGMIVLEFCLNLVLMSWLVVPIMVGTTTAEGRGLQPVRMGQYPLGLGNLLAIGMLGRLIQPVYWILVGMSACALLPILRVAEPVAGLVAGLLFLFFSGLLAWSVELFGGALFSSRHGREMMMLGVLILLVPAFLLVSGDYEMTDGVMTFSIFDRSWLLLSADAGEGLLTKARLLSPAVWVSDAAKGVAVERGILLLSLAAGISAVLSVVSLRRVMLHPPSSLSGGKSSVRSIGLVHGLPVELGPLVIKELRYLTRTLDHLMGVGLGLAAVVWIFIRPEHLPFVLPLAAMTIVHNESAIPLNNFGLDGPGADRYRLLPLTGRQVLLTKNLAYFALVGIHLIPLVVVGMVKGAWMLTLATVLATGAMCLVTAVGGNMASIHSPTPRAFFNYDTKEQAGGGLALFLAVVVWLVPAGIFFGLVWLGMWAVALGMAVLLGIAWLIYRAWLERGGRAFENGAETMRGRLSQE